MSRYWPQWAICWAATLSGCASLSPVRSFDEVQTTVADRHPHRIEWRGVSSADAEVDARIDAILRSPLTVDEAVQIALLSNRRLQAMYEDLGIAQADLVEAGLLQNPVFEAEFRLPGRPANPYELHVVQDFIDVFLIPLRKKVAASALEASKLRVADAVLDHAAQTQKTFYHFQAAQQRVEMHKTIVEATQASALLAQRRQKAGNISDLDLANEQALAEQSHIDNLMAQMQVSQQRENLNSLMGLSGAQAHAWMVDSRLDEPATDGDRSDSLESLAIAQRLDLLAARREIESLGQSLGLKRAAALVPALEIGAHVEREPDGPATWGPSASFALPVLNWGRPGIARASAKLRQKQQEYLAMVVEVQAEVRSAQTRMSAAREIASRYQSAMLPLRERIVQESQLHYNAMQIGPSQLLQARQAELQAGGGYIDALETYWVAHADLERVVGGRLDPGRPTDTESAKPTQPAPQENATGHGDHR